MICASPWNRLNVLTEKILHNPAIGRQRNLLALCMLHKRNANRVITFQRLCDVENWPDYEVAARPADIVWLYPVVDASDVPILTRMRQDVGEPSLVAVTGTERQTDQPIHA